LLGVALRVAAAATRSFQEAVTVGLRAGAFSGILVVAMVLLGIITLLFTVRTLVPTHLHKLPFLLVGYSFGASFVALFAQLGGGIYTKAADVGADMVGKVESDIPEDDPRNPAVVADLVGDNVGDVAGMGADLFESYVGSIIAATTLASSDPELDRAAISLPFWLSAAGVLCSIIGYFAVSTKQKGSGLNVDLSTLMWALEKGIYLASFLFAASAARISVIASSVKDSDQGMSAEIAQL